VNLMAYVGNNPVLLNDPSGESSAIVGFEGFAGAFGFGGQVGIYGAVGGRGTGSNLQYTL
jgi:hypothetical protein